MTFFIYNSFKTDPISQIPKDTEQGLGFFKVDYI